MSDSARIVGGLIQDYDNLMEPCQLYTGLDGLLPAHYQRLIENIREFQDNVELVHSNFLHFLRMITG